MKKGLIVLCICMVLVMVLSSLANAEEDRTGKMIVKAGVMIPTLDDGDLLGSANFTVEGEYVIYSSEYIDISGIFGYYRTGFNNPTPVTNNYNFNDLNSIYYMGGVKIYPAKEGFYICGYVGGGTTFVSGSILQHNINLRSIDDSYSGIAFKLGVGADIGDNFVIEAAYLVQGSEDLSLLLNSAGQKDFQNTGGIQIMGGYSF